MHHYRQASLQPASTIKHVLQDYQNGCKARYPRACASLSHPNPKVYRERDGPRGGFQCEQHLGDPQFRPNLYLLSAGPALSRDVHVLETLG